MSIKGYAGYLATYLPALIEGEYKQEMDGAHSEIQNSNLRFHHGFAPLRYWLATYPLYPPPLPMEGEMVLKEGLASLLNTPHIASLKGGSK